MKTYFERVDELRDNTNFTVENHPADYVAAETALVDLFAEQIKGAEITSTSYGIGLVLNSYGDTLDQMVMEVNFFDSIRKFAVMPVITGKVLFIKFSDIPEIRDMWDYAFDLHTDLTRKNNEIKNTIEQMKKEAEKKAEADKKAEAKYQQLKEKALKDFDTLLEKKTEISKVDEFYYALGWLANHMGSMTAILPDYLGPAFEKHFGESTPKTLVDSRAKTSGGYAKQWSWEFKCSIKKLKNTVVPACIQNVTTDFSKGIHNTSFLWDLVDNYGFQFGKSQDTDKIAETIPAKYIDSFKEGLTA